MTKENVLFSVIGLLFGYVVAFTLVIYLNQSQPAPPAARAGGAAQTAAPAGDLPADHPPVNVNSVKDQQKLEEGMQVAAREARANPADFEAQVRAANAAAQAEKYEDAIDYLTRANQLRPGDSETLVKLGRANFEANRYDVAERWYKEALARNPDDLDTRSDLALTYYLRQPPDPEAALAEFRRTLERDPRHVPTLHNMTLVLKQTGKLSEAAAAFAKLEKITPGSPDLQRLREELEGGRKGSTGAPAAPPSGARGGE